MRHFITALFFVGAFVADLAGGTPGAATLLIAGVALESVGWYRILRRKPHSPTTHHG